MNIHSMLDHHLKSISVLLFFILCLSGRGLPLQAQAPSDSLKAASLLLKGQALWETGQVEAAEPLLQQAFQFFSQASLGIQELRTLQVLLPLLVLSNQEDKIKGYLQQIQNPEEDHPADRAAIFDQMARIYHLRRNHKAAKEAQKRAIQLYFQAQQYEQAAQLLYWLSQQSDDKLQRLMYLDQAENIIDSLDHPKNQEISIQIRTAKAASYLDYQNLQQADSLLSRNLKQPSSSQLLAQRYVQLGRLYWYKESYYQAESYLAKAYVLLRNQRKPLVQAQLYFYWAGVKADLGDRSKARTYYQRALNALQLGPPLNIEQDFHSSIHLLDPQRALDILMQYSIVAEAPQALQAIKNAIFLIQQSAMSTGLPYYSSYYDQVYRRGLDLVRAQGSKQPEYVKMAYLWMEQRRNQKIAAALYPNFDCIAQDSLLRNGQTMALRYQQQLQQYAHQPAYRFEKKLEQWEQLFRHWKQELQKQQPRLYALRYQNLEENDLDQYLANQHSKQTMIYYYLDAQSAYAAVLRGDQSMDLYQITDDGEYLNKLVNLQELLSQPLQQSFVLCSKALHQFHKDWLHPLHIKEASQLLIIPDGPLFYIPFEAALEKETKAEGFHQLEYLILEKDIHYQYRLTDLTLQPSSTKNKGNILAFAANYELPQQTQQLLNDFQLKLRKQLKPLPQAQKELDLLFERFRGSFYYQQDANEHTLKHSGKDNLYSVLHLAMRSIPNAQQLYLALNYQQDNGEDDLVTAAEIMQMQLNADLVVLSALNIGQAAWTEQYHDLFLGLEYSFILNGIPSVVRTLWETDTKPSTQIIQLFYELLSRGYTKTEALHEAKRVYIAEARSDLAHPFYWANLIHCGNDQAIELNKRSFIERYWFYGMLIVFSILGFAIFIWRINQLSLGRQ